MNKQPELTAPAAVPVPSADLINYRFDQADKKFEEMNKKLDTILVQNARFVPEDRVQAMIDSSLKVALEPVKSTMRSYGKWGIAIFSATITLFGVIMAALIGIHRI